MSPAAGQERAHGSCGGLVHANVTLSASICIEKVDKYMYIKVERPIIEARTHSRRQIAPHSLETRTMTFYREASMNTPNIGYESTIAFTLDTICGWYTLVQPCAEVK